MENVLFINACVRPDSRTRILAQEVLDCLEDGMSFDQWIYAFCQRENVRTRNEFKFSIVERNFANFVDWLTDEGKVEVRREFCAKHYFHREK